MSPPSKNFLLCLFLLLLCGPWYVQGMNKAGAAEVAYLAYTGGYWQAWVMAGDGSGSRQITRSPYDKSRLSWYPDGKHLLVNGVQGELARVSVMDGREERITLAVPGAAPVDAVLSPGGDWITFSNGTGAGRGDNHIWLVRADGREPRRLTGMPHLQHDPAWGPDGQWIYFLSSESSGQFHDIWRVAREGGETQQLTVGELYNFDVSVSIRGAVAYSSNRAGSYQIWVQDTEGKTSARMLTDDPALDGRPAWSPDGDRLLFESSRGGLLNLWKLELDGGGVKQITHHEHGARFPVWRQRLEASL